MPKNEIPLPSDIEIIERFIRMLDGMDNALDNVAIFATVPPGEKEALQLAVKRALACAYNVRISLK